MSTVAAKTTAELAEWWAVENPRPYWTPEFWAACRPSFEDTEDKS